MGMPDDIDAEEDSEAEVARDIEIRDRIRAIDEGCVTGILYGDVVRKADCVVKEYD